MRALRRTIIAAIVFAAASAGTASAANIVINWLDMSPTPFNSSVPNNSVFNLPGVGPVTVTYNIPPTFTDARTTNPCLQNGTLVFGPDTYFWSTHELFATVLNSGPDPLVPVQWTITYTFPGTLAPGTLFVGVAGLGATTSFGGGTSTAQVNQNGTFLGDWSGGCGPWGPTQFTGGVGTFQMQNSVTGAGGQDPHWNTPLGVVRILDPVNSLTVIMNQLRGDGVGVNIGYFDIGLPTETSSWGRVKSLYR